MGSFADKKIAIGVCGGIAAYKACELVRVLRKGGAQVRVTMTESAQRFVSELTFAALSENPVAVSLFEGQEKLGTVHIDLARWADVVVICPATANIIAKVANGIADDMLTTTILATDARILFCPAMNSAMWEKPVVQQNIEKLRNLGYDFVEPEFGAFATSAEGEGWGRLAAIENISHGLKQCLYGSDELRGRKVLVTAGPTREPLDPVRYFTNYASGKMGFALADSAHRKGAEVVLISGPNHLPRPVEVRYIGIETVKELQDAIAAEYDDTDILLMAAAVSDYRPESISGSKLKKTEQELVVKMKRNPDILAELGKRKQGRFHVGFALETDDGVARAKQKLHAKNLDMVVLNDPNQPGAAFAGDTNIVTIITKDGKHDELSLRSKAEVADHVLELVCSYAKERKKQGVAI